jgi:hypothetical protein
VDLANKSRTDVNCLRVVPVDVHDELCGSRVVTPQEVAGRPDVLGHAERSLGYSLEDVRGVR